MRRILPFLSVLSLIIAGQLHAQTQTFSYTGSVQTYTVPAGVTSISIAAKGGQGGNGGGLGAGISGAFTVTPGDVLKVLVGQMGGMYSNSNGGGGGGSFVWKQNGNTLLIAAGGGGGRSGNSNGSTGGPGSSTTAPTNSAYGSGNSAGGTNGSGGTGGTYQSYGGGTGGGGAGWLSNGLAGTGTSNNATGGSTPLNGGAGGFGYNTCGGVNVFGGYGGGGGAGGCSGASGGGGGYNGGGGGNDWNGNTWGSGGGGGSYNGGTNQTNTQGANSGDGQVVISILQTQATALDFSGAADYVALGASASAATNFTTSSQFTIEGWIKLNSTNGYSTVFANRGSGASVPGFAFFIYYGKPYLEAYSSGAMSTTTVSAGTWTHVATTFANGTVKLYVNGTPAGSATNVNILSASSPSALLGVLTNGWAYFDGSMDEVRIWNRALCQGEIQNNMNCELSSVQSGLLAYYKFNQGYVNSNNSGITTLNDASGNGYNGTLNGFNLSGTNSNWTAGTVGSTSCATFIPPTATITAQSATTFCDGNSVILDANAGTGYTYQWRKNGTNINGATSSSYTATTSGTYSVIVTVGGCTATSAPTTVTVNPLPTISITPSATSVCDGASVTLTANGGNSYSWEPPATLSSTTGTTVTATPTSTTTYYVTAVDGNGCSNGASQTIVVNPNPIVSATSNSPLIITNTLQLNGTGATTYSWTGPNSFTASGANPTRSNVQLTDSGTYTVIGTDANNCSASATTSISISAPAAKALHFDGQDDWVNVSSMPAINAIPVTLEAYVKPELRTDANNGVNTFYPNNVLSNDVPGYYGLGFGANVYTDGTTTTAKIVLEYKNGFREIVNPVGLAAGQWAHIAVVYNNGNVKTYVNGSLVDNFNYTQAPLNGNTYMFIGRHNDDANYGTRRFFKGAIDEVRVWNRALCAAEVSAQYSCQLNGTGNGLYANYSFDQGVAGANNSTVTTLNDATSNAANGTLSSTFALNGTSSNWIAPGGASGNCTPYLIGDINARGNGNTIYSGTNTVSTFNNTNMGSTNPAAALSKTFTIENTGTGALTVNGISFTGANASSFSVNGITFPVTLSAGTSTTFNVTFSATTTGIKTATVNIASDDCDEGTYTYALSASVVCPAIATTITKTEPLCNGAGNGSITLGVPTAGTAPFSYSINGGGTYQSSNIFSNLTANTYSVIVKDNYGCTSNAQATTLNQPAPLTAGTTISNVTCAGGSDGAISVSAQGGTTPYLYSINNGASYQASASFTGLNAQSYSVIVKDANNCQTAVQTVSVIAVNAAPSFSGVNLYLQAGTSVASCDTIVSYPGLTVAGTPSPAVTYTFTGATAASGSGTGSGETFNKGLTHVTVTATNTCGTQTANFDVTVVDNVKPVALCQPVTINLDATGKANITAAQVDNGSHDNCGPVTLSVVNEGIICGTAAEGSNVMLQAPAGTIIDRIDFASYGTPGGSCGNFSAGGCNAANSKSIVEAYALNRNSATIPASNNVFGDPCNGIVKRLYVQAHYSGNSTTNTYSCSNIGSNPITLTVTDAAGNVSTCTTTVTVKDITAPTVVTRNITVTLDASGNATINAAQVNNGSFDNCSIAGMSVSPRTFNCNNLGNNTVVLSATDASGNTGTASATVTVIDNRAPSISAPAPIVTVSSHDSIGNCSTTYNVPAPSTADNCGVSSIMATIGGGMVINPSTYAYPVGTTTIIWSVKDASNNISNTTQTITVTDDELPSITAPANITVGADNGSCAATNVNLGSPVTGDNCGVASVTNDAPASFAKGTTIITWTLRDVNGNINTATQTVTVEDRQAPAFTASTIPADVTVSCDNIPAVTTPAATDNCDANPSITFAETSTQTTSGPGHYNYSITRTWTATDAANNASTASQVITVQDNTAPAFTASTLPANATVSCDNIPVPASPAATDNCDLSPVITLNEVSTQAATGVNHFNYTITRTWTATDETGNSSTASQVITVQDVAAPVFNASSVPSDVTVSCDAVPSPADPTATDNCDPSPVVSFTETSTQTASGIGHYNYSITRTWTATDVTGNSATTAQVITVHDQTAPVLAGVPTNATVACENVPIAAIPTATDNCDPNPVITLSELNTQDPNTSASAHYNYTITRTWTATDVAGNSSSATQTITVQDIVAPAISVPAPVTINCQDNALPANTGTATATDACSPVAISYTDTSTQDANQNNAGHYNYTITRTWTATDISGNASSGTQTITVQDVTNPVFTMGIVPADLTVSCDNVPAPASPSATDNCATPVITLSQTSTQSNDVHNTGHYNYSITRVWTATDPSGNSTTATQVISVQDIVSPAFVAATIPANATVSCDNIPAPASLSATDNCDPSPVITLSETSTQSNNPALSAHYNYTISRTWTATDVSSNASTTTQLITVQDITAPVAKAKNITVTLANGTAVITPAMVDDGSYDNCTPAANLALSLSKSSFGCSNIGANTITLTVKDVSGNIATVTAIVNVVGSVPAATISVTPSSTVYTGGVPTNIYLGYGPQSATLTATAANGAPFSYDWTVSTTSTGLNATNIQSPVFTPTSGGVYTYTVKVTNVYGCTATVAPPVVFCVKDIRVPGFSNKVYVCHASNNGNNTLSVSTNAVASHLAHDGDKLGSCDQTCGSAMARGLTAARNELGDEVKIYPNPNNGLFTVELPYIENKATITVTDVAGKTIQTRDISYGDGFKFTFDLSEMARGLYLVDVHYNDQHFRTRLVVQ